MLGAMALWNSKQYIPMGLFTPGASCVSIFSAQFDWSQDHMPGAAACSTKGPDWWRCFQNQCKHRGRVFWASCCRYRWCLKTDSLSPLYTQYHFCIKSKCIHSRSVNRAIMGSTAITYEKRNMEANKIVGIQLWRYIFCMYFMQLVIFLITKGCLWQMISQCHRVQSIIKHTKSACLLIMNSKLTLELN